MKYRYKFHPYEYALGENEKFYGDMEAKGWRLVKRGAYLSKFVPTEPNRARYRIEVVTSGIMENGCTMPPEQRAVYEDCGWEYISGRNLLHIFRAPEGSSAPEFYADPAEQAATLKSLRWQAVSAGTPFFLILLINLLLVKGGPQKSLSFWYRGLIEQTAIMTAAILVILQALYSMLRGAWHVNRTYRRLKKGIPLDHNPREHFVPKSGGGLVLAIIILFAILTVSQWIGTKSQDLPWQADGPYLLLSDLGSDMPRRPAFRLNDPESSITHTSSLLADYWDVYETLGDESVNYWMYQDVYRLHSPKMAESFAAVLRNTSTFGRRGDHCTSYVMEDMVAWVYKDIEIIAVSGNMVAHITGLGYRWTDPTPEQVLTALQERWKEYRIITDGKTEEKRG